MAGRRKGELRREPTFDVEPPLAGAPESQAGAEISDGEPGEPKQSKPRRRRASAVREAPEAANDDAPATKPARARSRPAARKRRGGRGGGRGRGGSSVLRRMFYWSLVLGLWAMLGVAGVLAWATFSLPPIQSLAIPKRPPPLELRGP